MLKKEKEQKRKGKKARSSLYVKNFVTPLIFPSVLEIQKFSSFLFITVEVKYLDDQLKSKETR